MSEQEIESVRQVAVNEWISACFYTPHQGAASLTVTAKSLRWRHFFDDADLHHYRHILNRMTN